MRLFIAIRLNDEMRDALISAQEQMYDGGVRGNFSPEENLHLTVAFIGEYPEPADVMDVLEGVSFTPFEISLDGVGSFGNLWWAGLKESPALQAVVRRIRRALSEAQIPFDKKPFRPHITLVRKIQITQGIPEVRMENAGMQVTEISLMRSDRGKNGMIYTEVGVIEADG